MREKFLKLRQWSVAVLAAVTGLGVASFALAGPASATPTAATAALLGTPTTIPPTGVTPLASGFTITVQGVVYNGDEIQLTTTPFGGQCFTNDGVWWAASTSNLTGSNIVSDSDSGTSGAGWAYAGGALKSSSTCPSPYLGLASTSTQLTLIVSGITSTASYCTESTDCEQNPVLTLSNLDVASLNAAPGVVSISGKYIAFDGGSVNFSVPSDMTVSPVAVSADVPAVTLTTGESDIAISPITLSEPVAGYLRGYTCITLGSLVNDTMTGAGTSGAGWDVTSPPTVSAGGSAVITSPGGTSDEAGYDSVETGTTGEVTLAFDTTTPSSSATVYTVSNLHVDTTSTASGDITLQIATGENSTCNAPYEFGLDPVYTGADATPPGATSISTTATFDPVPNSLEYAQPSTSGSTSQVSAQGVSATNVAGMTTNPGTEQAGTLTGTVTTAESAIPAVINYAPNLLGTIELTGYGTLAPSPHALTIGVTSQATYGQTPDATAAAELEAAFPGGIPCGCVVLSTDADPYDALSAAYLEGQLGTGLLITPPTSLDTNTSLALRIEGITTVYVVGGPKAIAPSVISTLQSTLAYSFGGTTQGTADITVIGPIYGATADDTAQAIDTYYPAGSVGTGTFSSAYTASNTKTGGGLFNDTTGTGSSTGVTSAVATAIVVSDTDFQDSMTASVMAYHNHFPVVLTQVGNNASATLGTQASTTLTTLGIRQVILLGGQLAMPNSVVGGIQALNGGITVLRIAGQDGTDTAAQLAMFEIDEAPYGLGWVPTEFIASHGDYWSDALGAAALGGSSAPLGGTEIIPSVASANTSTCTATPVGGYSVNKPFNSSACGWDSPVPIVITENPTTVGTYLTALLNLAGSATGVSNEYTNYGVTVSALYIVGGPLAMPAALVSAMQAALAS